jgi:uncharacterized protein YidB (DUF937 family)
MGLLDQVTDMLGGDGGRDKLLGAAMGLVGGKDGLQGLVSKLDAAGLGDQARSWIGSGDNKAVSPAEVRQALGDDELHKVAQEAGVNDDEAADGLAGLLPEVISKLTPDGKMPDIGDLKDIAGKFLGR